jgi:hypothetical protein
MVVSQVVLSCGIMPVPKTIEAQLAESAKLVGQSILDDGS